ncbi:unnamed protein product (macronuclear) [Paramecium tetraurelia]|uniref:Uncharacterized protein n=1 Tax=Paramecium tetraurelia TaxID=5888 RepID=A0DTW9_PARTE|nr:uncharacterized protein GSPATT00020169001 [Paramecium tetraurelia]CAK86486.1 unnamed protein product [Paramecium tetraurelia]|eukprot:XP_001453883.1 hypothetical protein (macronuclear) [Paramecium tetraurelia strain d4-2]
MNHQGFFGTALKRNSKKLNSKRGEECLNNKLFANDNLRKIQLPKQLTQQYCFSFEQGVNGIRIETKSPSKQLRVSNNSKQNIENTSFQPETLKFSYNQQFLAHDISPLIRIRKLQLDRVSQNQKQLTVGQQCFDFLTNKRIRAQSFVEERCLSPDQKKTRPRLNLLIQRNLHSESFRQSDNQLENY